MTYKEALEYINKVGQYGSVLGLESIRELLYRLGDPQTKLKFIHVGGTNGKGSTSAYLTSILTNAGYKVGRYVSPVLIEYRECIQITAADTTTYIKESQVASHMSTIRRVCESMVADGLPHPTTFEVETAMAFLEFVNACCDLVVLEVGLGGRLDATNVIEQVVCSVITSISMDHMAFLGDTIEAIAKEKAGIIKEKSHVVSYAQRLEVTRVIKAECEARQASYQEIDTTQLEMIESCLEGSTFTYKQYKQLHTALLGAHQLKNAALAIETAMYLNANGYPISDQVIREGINKTQWFGRLTVLNKNPWILLDGAHNEDAAIQLSKALKEYYGEKKGIFVFGVFADKEYDNILRVMLPWAKRVYTITPNNKRALDSHKLCEVIASYGVEVYDGKTAEQGLAMALSSAKKEDYILCFGSLSFLGDIYREWGKNKGE